MKYNYLFLIIFFLSACIGNVEKHWNCHNPEGKGCVTIADSDENTAKGVVGWQTLPIGLLPTSETDITTKNLELKPSDQSQVRRSLEITHRLWFAPFIDQDGNHHEASYLNIVVKTPKWLVE